ncbi:hypothetical protein Pelo_13327 [Pelomyxa schiedti]|nr:hypothetical protein Pelo_13327 [Pelomyxa schiedti]
MSVTETRRANQVSSLFDYAPLLFYCGNASADEGNTLEAGLFQSPAESNRTELAVIFEIWCIISNVDLVLMVCHNVFAQIGGGQLGKSLILLYATAPKKIVPELQLIPPAAQTVALGVRDPL